MNLAHFHIMFFAVTMGLGGFAMAYRELIKIAFFSDFYFILLRFFVSFLFCLITLLYVLKIFKHFDEVKKEFSNTIKINFFSTFPISLLILANLWQDFVFLHDTLFYIALVLQTYLSFYIISFWINKNLEIEHSSPAWFIPVVGNLIIIVGARTVEPWLWFYFSLAMFFWIVLFCIIFYRILFHSQLPNKFMPTLFIMIAPPSVGFLDYLKLTNSFDVFAIMLLNLALFFSILLVFMYKNFLKLNFALSWWAFTFPSAAMCVACFKAYELSASSFFMNFALFIFLALVLMIVFISYHTIKNILNKSIFSD